MAEAGFLSHYQLDPYTTVEICDYLPSLRAFAHGAMGRRIDPSWGGPIELFLVAATAPRLE